MIDINLDLLSGKVVKLIEIDDSGLGGYEELWIYFEDGTFLRVGAERDSNLYVVAKTPGID